MPKYNVNESFDYKPIIPNGTYDFLIDSLKRGRKGKPSEFLHIKFRVSNHPDYKDKIFGEIFSLRPRAIWKLAKLFIATGYPNEEFDTDDDDFLREHLVGKMVRLQLVTHEMDKGKRQGIANNGFFKVEGNLPKPDDSNMTDAVEQFLEGDDDDDLPF